jgi:hypothetical protein
MYNIRMRAKQLHPWKGPIDIKFIPVQPSEAYNGSCPIPASVKFPGSSWAASSATTWQGWPARRHLFSQQVVPHTERACTSTTLFAVCTFGLLFPHLKRRNNERMLSLSHVENLPKSIRVYYERILILQTYVITNASILTFDFAAIISKWSVAYFYFSSRTLNRERFVMYSSRARSSGCNSLS